MKLFKKLMESSARLAVISLFCLIVVPALLADATETDELAKIISKELSAAERLMVNGKKEESDVALEAASEKIKELAQMAPEHNRLAMLRSQYERTRKTLDKRLGRVTSETSASSTPPLPPRPEVAPAAAHVATVSPPTNAAADKLPGGVSKRLRDVSKVLDKVEERLANHYVSNAQYDLKTVPELIAEIDRMYAGQFSPEHPEYQAMMARYAVVQAQVEAALESESAVAASAEEAQAATNAVAQNWVDRFAPYLSGSYFPSGHKPAHSLDFPGTAFPEEIPAALANYETAKQLYAEFEASGVADAEMPWPLDQASRDFKYALEGFEDSLRSATDEIVGRAESNVEQALAQLGRSEWKDDSEALPPMIQKDWMERMDSLISASSNVLPPDDARLTNLREKLVAIRGQDAAHREVWQSRIRVRPEVYGGSDRSDLRKKAEEIALKDHPDARILRVSIYQEDWKEESVIEATDSTHTATRHRVTRMINAQVVTKEADEVILHTLHLAKDRRTDGTWGSLYGHIMFSDRMLEKNVEK